MTTPRVVVAHRASEYDELLARHGTRGQVGFVLDPRPGVNAGVLVTRPATAAGGLLAGAARGTARVLERTMVEAVADDGQRLIALNELFVGQPGHQSARYTMRVPVGSERQSSSGVIVGPRLVRP